MTQLFPQEDLALAIAELEGANPDTEVQEGATRPDRALHLYPVPEIDNDIDTLVRGSPVWRDKEELMISFPGVSNTLARTFLAEVPELGTLNRRQIASLAGLAPFTRQSGRWKGKSMIGGGRAALRAGLYMAALSASQHHPQLKAFYRRLLAAGKPKMVALIAVARKILTILNAMLRDQKQWQTA